VGPYRGPRTSGTQDSKGQPETTNVEVSERFAAITWDAKPLERAFTQERSLAGETLLCVVQGRPRPAMTRRSRGSDLIQRRGKADACGDRPTPSSPAKRYDSRAT
jgi:hypothetical protein